MSQSNPQAKHKRKSFPADLGPGTRARRMTESGICYNLVVCGATDYKEDGWIFADFMGVARLLRRMNIQGLQEDARPSGNVPATVISCFPVEQHFEFLETELKIMDIKFGDFGTGVEPLIVFTNAQFKHAEKFWMDISSADIKATMMSWIADKVSVARVGDSVNIYCFCHGTDQPGEGLYVGSNFVNPIEVSLLLTEFRPEVQVNFITAACYSGRFVNAIKAVGEKSRWIVAACKDDESAWSFPRSASNRIRCGIFGQAWCQSLARVHIASIPQQPIFTIGDHETWMRQYISRAAAPLKQTYQSWTSTNIDLQQAVETMILRKMTDFIYSADVTHSRRRIEHPTLNEDLMDIFRSAAGPASTIPPGNVSSVTKAAESLASDELALCDGRMELPSEQAIFTTLKYSVRGPHTAEGIKCLYWRGRYQNAIFDTFMLLCDKLLLDFECLRTPFSVVKVTERVGAVSGLLLCFEGSQRHSKLPAYGPFALHNPHWRVPEKWLAAMIIRSSAGIDDILQTIEASQFLGKLDEAAFERWKQYAGTPQFTVNPEENAPTYEGEPKVFGFWLPHGIKGPTKEEFAFQLRAHQNRFNRIERVFKAYFDVPDTRIVLEGDQESYLRRNPAKDPSRKLSGQLPSPPLSISPPESGPQEHRRYP